MGGKFTSGERRGLTALLIVVGIVWAAVAFTHQCDRATDALPCTSPVPTVRADTLRDTAHRKDTPYRKSRQMKKRQTRPTAPAGRQRSFLDEDIPVKQQ